jgi:uncharacterized integral membrane protein
MTQHTAANRSMSVPGEEEANLWARTKIAAGIVALAALGLFLLQNFQNVELHFLWMTWHPRLVWGLLAAAIAGAVATAVLGALRARTQRTRVRTKAIGS